MAAAKTPPQWQSSDKEAINEIMREAEARLAAQVQIATSADQRATVLAGIYVAAATGIIGALVTAPKEVHSPPLYGGASAAVMLFLVGAFFCIWATMPVKFWTPGNAPEEWYPDIIAKRDLNEAKGEQIENYNSMILDNAAVMKSNGRKFKSGALLGACAPVGGLIAAGLTCLAKASGFA